MIYGNEDDIVFGTYDENGFIYRISSYPKDTDKIEVLPNMIKLNCHDSDYIGKHYSELPIAELQ